MGVWDIRLVRMTRTDGRRPQRPQLRRARAAWRAGRHLVRRICVGLRPEGRAHRDLRPLSRHPLARRIAPQATKLRVSTALCIVLSLTYLLQRLRPRPLYQGHVLRTFWHRRTPPPLPPRHQKDPSAPPPVAPPTPRHATPPESTPRHASPAPHPNRHQTSIPASSLYRPGARTLYASSVSHSRCRLHHRVDPASPQIDSEPCLPHAAPSLASL